jgi:DNA invertase Pin-like site-specific DNA recombinase
MTTYGYARVSTTDQTLETQIELLTKAGAETIFAEKQSGRSRENRDELALCLAGLRKGDVLLVTRLDRIARSMRDLASIVGDLVDRGVEFRCLNQSGINTTDYMGRFLLNILGAVAEMEADLIRDRQREGIARAQREGRYIAAPRKTQMAEARALRGEGLTAFAIAGRLGLSVRSVYRLTRGCWGAAA